MKLELEYFLNQCAAEGWSPRSVHEYRKRIGYCIKFLRQKGRSRYADVVPDDLDAYLESLAARGLKKNTRLNAAFAAKSFFTWLAENGKTLINPARNIAIPDDGEPDLLEPPLEEHEVAAILDNLPKRNVVDLRNRAHLELLYGCGLRIAESVNLDLKDASLSTRTVHVRAGKGGKDRLIPMMGGVQGALKDYLALRRSLLRGPDHGALFLGRRGTRLNPATFQQWLLALGKRLQPKPRRINPHLFRHSIAVHLLRNGADIRHVQEFLGHANLETTKVYLRLVPGRLKEDYEKAMPDIAIIS